METLTFTKERYILNRAHYRDDGVLDHEWANSGTWNRTGSNTVTRTFWRNDDDDDDTTDVLTTISKHFVWGDESRQLLLIHHWDDEEERTEPDYDAYRRVTNPIPSPIGTWRGTDEWDQGPVVYTIMVRADGTFEFQVDEVHGTNNLYATWEFDEDNYYINIMDAYTTFGEPPERDPEGFSGTGRFAYAPTDSPNEITMSFHWDENEENPYGGYGRRLVRPVESMLPAASLFHAFLRLWRWRRGVAWRGVASRTTQGRVAWTAHTACHEPARSPGRFGSQRAYDQYGDQAGRRTCLVASRAPPGAAICRGH